MHGDLCYKMGNIKEAKKFYYKNRDYSNTNEQIIETYVDLIKVDYINIIFRKENIKY